MNKWKDYDGEYEKEEYVIVLKNGTMIYPCWPNAGKFHALDGSKRIIDGEDVHRIRLCEENELSF